MAVAVRSTSTLTYASSRTNSVFTAPAGIVNDDILLIVMNIGDPTIMPPLAATPPAGFTEATGSPAGMSDGGAFVISIRVYWKKASSESGSYTVTHTAGNTEGVMYCISGADGTTPLSPTPTFATGNLSNGQTTTATGLTTPVAGCLVIMSEALYDDTTGMTVVSGSTPTFTERYKGTIQYTQDGILASAGATGNKSHTNGNNAAGTPWVATLISVQPSTVADLNVTGAQTTRATTQTGVITVDVPPEPETPVAPGGPSRAAQRRLKQAIENRSRFEAERARRLANLTNDRSLFVTPPETLEMINEALVEEIDHSVLFENEDQDEELLLLLMMI
jgi:hypothetical protein